MRSRMALLARLLGTAVAACHAARDAAYQSARLSAAAVAAALGRTGWAEDGGARAHVDPLLQSLQAVHARTPWVAAQEGAQPLARAVFGVTEILFSAHAAAVTAAPVGPAGTPNGVRFTSHLPRIFCCPVYNKHVPF